MLPARSTAGNLPLELTSFVGRRRELTEARRLLSVSRPVTLSGIGGVGKTRLALRVAGEVLRVFGDGVWLVELGQLRDASLLAEVIATSLRLRDQSARAVQEVLAEYLAGRRLLLVLDNCEHLIEAVDSLATTLLRTCPELRILATSREQLGIGGEAAMRVPPMTVPDPDRPSLHAAMASGLLGDTARAVSCQQEVLAITESRGESEYRARSLWVLALMVWQQGNSGRATKLVAEGLQMTRLTNDPVGAAWCLQTLAWIAADEHQSRRAAVLLGASEALRAVMGTTTVLVCIVFGVSPRRPSKASSTSSSTTASAIRPPRA